MYLVGLAGLGVLLRHRGQLSQTRATVLAGHALIGFAAWQVLDVVIVHWVLGLHRVRMDASAPLAWDIGWLIIFGVATGLWGWRCWPAMDRRVLGAGRRRGAPRRAACWGCWSLPRRC
ncbi:DUF2243 domain-containing protein [Pigmentiphaga litoralis]|uniref:DUF2243 domain-containing protein n=1 Tax=Pigmentiphaga litoralis TaxID=516702 RepID=UPI003B4331AC